MLEVREAIAILEDAKEVGDTYYKDEPIALTAYDKDLLNVQVLIYGMDGKITRLERALELAGKDLEEAKRHEPWIATGQPRILTGRDGDW